MGRWVPGKETARDTSGRRAHRGQRRAGESDERHRGAGTWNGRRGGDKTYKDMERGQASRAGQPWQDNGRLGSWAPMLQGGWRGAGTSPMCPPDKLGFQKLTQATCSLEARGLGHHRLELPGVRASSGCVLCKPHPQTKPTLSPSQVSTTQGCEAEPAGSELLLPEDRHL